jgi:hypothetical protein
MNRPKDLKYEIVGRDFWRLLEVEKCLDVD